MKSALPLFGMIVVSLIIVLGVVFSGAMLREVNYESNLTHDNETLKTYEIQTGWNTVLALVAVVLAAIMALFYFMKVT